MRIVKEVSIEHADDPHRVPTDTAPQAWAQSSSTSTPPIRAMSFSSSPSSSRNSRKIKQLLASNPYTSLIFVMSFLTVFGPDIVVLALPMSIDRAWMSLLMVLMILFSLDIILQIMANRNRFVLSLFFLLDILATLSIVPAFLPLFGYDSSDFTADSVSLTRVARVVRGFSKTGKILRFIKLVKLCVFYRKETFSADESIVADEDLSKAGVLLHRLTIRNIVIGVMLMFFFPVIFDLIENPKSLDDYDGAFINSAVKAAPELVNPIATTYFQDALLKTELTSGPNVTSTIYRTAQLRAAELLILQSRAGSLVWKFYINRRHRQTLTSYVNLLQSVFVLLIVMLGNYFFTKDADRLFVFPVSKMLDGLRKLENTMYTADIFKATENTETTVLYHAWQLMLKNIGDQQERSYRLLRFATSLARSIAVMELDEAETCIELYSNSKTELHSHFVAIVTNLKRFKPFLPKSLFVVYEDEETKLDGTTSQAKILNPDELEFTVAMPQNVLKQFEKKWASRWATVLCMKLIDIERVNIDNVSIHTLEEINEELVFKITQIVESCGGVVLSFTSSSIIASWNSHSRCVDHWMSACKCALHIEYELSPMRAPEQGIPVILHMSITSGIFLVGNTGTSTFRSPEVLGCCLDLSQRIVKLNAHLGTTILISAEVASHVKPHIHSIPVDVVHLQGNKIVVYQLLASKTGMDPVLREDEYKNAFHLVSSSKFADAKASLYMFIHTHLSQLDNHELEELLMMDAKPTHCIWMMRCILKQALRLLVLCSKISNEKKEYVRLFGWKLLRSERDSNTIVEFAKHVPEVHRRVIERLLLYDNGKCSDTLRLDNEDYVGRIEKEFEELERREKADHAESQDVPSVPSIDSMQLQAMGGKVSDFKDTLGRIWSKSSHVLGQGGFGCVYLGLSDAGRLVAIKEIELNLGGSDGPSMNLMNSRTGSKTNSSIDDVLREIRVLVTLKNENIVALLGCGVSRTRHQLGLLMVMEYVPCGSLKDLADKFGKLPVLSVARYTKDILKGLKYLHDRDVIHRDIKPGNVLIDADGNCKLADFGTAGNIVQDERGGFHVAGTPMYMGPEAFRSAGKPSDIWSVGITVLELLIGDNPWAHLNLEDVSPVSLMFQIGVLGALPVVPDWLDNSAREFLSVCFQSDPALRPTCDQLLLYPFLT